MNFKRKYVEKPWGAEEHLFVGTHYAIKHLYLNPKEEISLQYHHEKKETMIVLEGIGELVLGEKGNPDSEVSSTFITEGDIFTIHPKTVHQVRAYTGLKILEVSTPQLTDLVRIKDKYRRS